jgi:hypothetical protein
LKIYGGLGSTFTHSEGNRGEGAGRECVFVQAKQQAFRTPGNAAAFQQLFCGMSCRPGSQNKVFDCGLGIQQRPIQPCHLSTWRDRKRQLYIRSMTWFDSGGFERDRNPRTLGDCLGADKRKDDSQL